MLSNELVLEIINAMPYHLAILDHEGTIVFANEAWREFAEQNDCPERNAGIGKNYKHFCDNKKCVFRDQEGELHDAIQKIIDGKRKAIILEYQCIDGRWFTVRASQTITQNGKWILIYHQEITKIIEDTEDEVKTTVNRLMEKINSILPPK